MMVYFTAAHLFIGLSALFIALIVLWRQQKSFSCLFFFSVFWMYMMGVISVVAFPFPVGITNPNFKPSINLIPLNFGDCSFLILCIRNIYENILLTIPFGFGISFIIQIKPNKIPWLAVAVGLVFERSQLIISLIVHSPFRVVDINDVILNAIGVLLGYGVFKIFGWFYLNITHRFNIQHKYIFAYIHNIAQNHNHHSQMH